MNKFSLLESVNDIKYLRCVVYEDFHSDFYSFVKEKTIDFDIDFENENNVYSISYSPISVNINDDVIIIISIDEFDNYKVEAFNNIKDAIEKIKYVKDRYTGNNKIDYYNLAIFEDKVSLGKNSTSLKFKDLKPLINIVISNESNNDNDKFEVFPENTLKIEYKPILNSMKGINKFNL